MVDSLNARDLLDFLGHGVLVVDKSAKIIYANKSAKNCLAVLRILSVIAAICTNHSSLAKEKYPLSGKRPGYLVRAGYSCFASKFADKRAMSYQSW